MYESWVIQEIWNTPESKIFAKSSSNASPWLKKFFNLGPLKRTKIKDFKEILIQNLTMIKEDFQFRSIETH